MVESPADAAVVQGLVEAQRPRDVWLLAAHKRPDPALLDVLAADLTLVDEIHLRRAAVWHYRLP